MKLGPACEECPYRDQPGPVKPDGPLDAELFIVGEGPGWDEIREKRGFVGAAGWEMWRLAAAGGVRRDQVRVSNLVKCLPLGAARGDYKLDPLAIEKCWTYLREEIKECQAKVIAPVGSPRRPDLESSRSFLYSTGSPGFQTGFSDGWGFELSAPSVRRCQSW